jgi:uncharacterized protein with gpF-like domain
MRVRDKVLRPVHPNAGISAAYRGKLQALIDEMQRSYVYFLRAQYRENPPRLALDATPAADLHRELSLLGRRWQKRIESAAPKLAEWFSRSTAGRSSAALLKILRDSGMAVEFKMTPTMKDAFDATRAENVALIKSIPQRFHTEVEGAVMRSVSAGRDLGQMVADLEARHRITRDRAALIARDQNNKATAVFVRVRQQEAGIEEAIWLHSHGGKVPRKTHLANTGKKYKISEGWFDPDPRVRRWIRPGELINCRCVSRSVVKGFS